MDTYNALKKDEFTTDFYQRVDLSGYVVFIDNGNQPEVVDYIKANYKAIQEVFKNKGKRFILWSEIVGLSSNLEAINYFYPRLAKHNNLELLNFETIIKYLGYKGNITTGLLSVDSTCEFIQFESNSAEGFKQLAEYFLSNIYIEEYDDLPFGFNDDSDENISLNKETKDAIDIIFNQFNNLKDNGNLLQVLPIVEQYLKAQNAEQLDELSTLKVDENFTIFLRDYNLEIKLSHLTKSIYLLFLNHPEGILLTELNVHKKELLEYYKNISNRIDLDKMTESIDDLIDISSNAIYVHLSRIKSAFTKAMHHSIAKHYFIDGGKNKPKRIDLNNNLIIWKNLFKNNSVWDDLLEMDIDE